MDLLKNLDRDMLEIGFGIICCSYIIILLMGCILFKRELNKWV